MSAILNPTAPLFAVENESGGLDIQGFEDQENCLNGTDGDDLIIGGEGDDILFGLGGNDTIEGRGGNDIISGGTGADILTGNAGNDLFVFDAADAGSGEIDFITDFVVGEDSLGILGLNQGDNVDYNRDSGVISVNGQDLFRIGRELPLTDRELDFESLNLEDDALSTDDILDTDVGSGTEGVEDVFVFSEELLDSDVIVPLEDFVPGEDTIRLEGTSSGDNIDYNRDSGILSINGEPFAQIGRELPLDENRDFDLL